jgi:hypothetical protein
VRIQASRVQLAVNSALLPRDQVVLPGLWAALSLNRCAPWRHIMEQVRWGKSPSGFSLSFGAIQRLLRHGTDSQDPVGGIIALRLHPSRALPTSCVSPHRLEVKIQERYGYNKHQARFHWDDWLP